MKGSENDCGGSMEGGEKMDRVVKSNIARKLIVFNEREQ